MGKRTRGADVSWEQVKTLLDKHVVVTNCSPKRLFEYRKSSRWSQIHTHRRMIRDLLEMTQGRTPRQIVLHGHVRLWLANHDMKWSVVDTERVAYNIRQYVMDLRTRRRKHRRAPMRFECLNSLLEQVHLSEDDDDDDDDQANNADDDDTAIAKAEAPDVEIVCPKTPPRIIVEVLSDDDDATVQHSARTQTTRPCGRLIHASSRRHPLVVMFRVVGIPVSVSHVSA